MSQVFVTINPDTRAFRATLRALRKIKSQGYVRKAVRPAVNKTATVLNRAMKSRARGVGQIRYVTRRRGMVKIPAAALARSIGIRRKTYAPTNWVVAMVGPRFGYTAAGGIQPSAFAIYVEGLDKSDALKSPPRPFARPAVRTSMQQMRSTFRRELVRGTVAVVRQLRAKGSKV